MRGEPEHLRSRMDLKVGKPDVWNPDKTPFLEWDHRWRAYMGMCSTAILSDLENIRDNPKRILIYSDLDCTRQQASNEVYFSLVILTSGKAATIVRTVRDKNGYEAYRLLRQRFGKHLTSLTQILKFDLSPILRNSWTSSLSGKASSTSTNRRPWKRFQRTFCAPSWSRRHQRPSGYTCSSNVERSPTG